MSDIGLCDSCDGLAAGFVENILNLIDALSGGGNVITLERSDEIGRLEVEVKNQLGRLIHAYMPSTHLNLRSTNTASLHEITENARANSASTKNSVVIEKLSIEGSGASRKLSATHQSDGNCMFYALWEAGLDADTAATLRANIFEEKSKVLRGKCTDIAQEMKMISNKSDRQLKIALMVY